MEKSTGNNLGLSEQAKFDPKKPNRAETNEQTQRPVSTTESVKTANGSFKMKG